MSRHSRWRRGDGADAAFAVRAFLRVAAGACATVRFCLREKRLVVEDTANSRLGHPCQEQPPSGRAGPASRLPCPQEPPATLRMTRKRAARTARPPGFHGLAYSFMSCSAGWTSLPPSTLMPRTRAWFWRQSPEASLFTHGRIAAQIACDEVCGTAPGMLVTQKWVTPSSTYVGSFQVVGREVSKQPPWSMAMSTT